MWAKIETRVQWYQVVDMDLSIYFLIWNMKRQQGNLMIKQVVG